MRQVDVDGLVAILAERVEKELQQRRLADAGLPRNERDAARRGQVLEPGEALRHALVLEQPVNRHPFDEGLCREFEVRRKHACYSLC